MAELEIGEHCSIKNCNILDFLPFTCDGCSQIFCIDHKGRTAHMCQDENYQNNVNKSAKIERYKCSFDICDLHEQVKICCTLCLKAFCLAHRNPEEHKCINLKQRTFEPTNLQKNISKIVENIKPKSTKKVGKKNEKLEAKVNLMKIKMKAVGDKGIPTSSRVYFEVDICHLQKVQLIYFALDWTVGKSVDQLSKIASVSNKNNDPNEPLLSLFTMSNDEFLRHNKTWEEILNDKIACSGSKLSLKYTDRKVVNE